MSLDAREDLAMVLPLPVDQSKGESALAFTNLEGYPEFFADLEACFPQPVPAGSIATASAPATAERTLKVFEVGSFEASFVPAEKDFARLDERFRLPRSAWDQLPEFRRFGFAVFKLKSGAREYHPMALSFERADRAKLFFPTVHIHDGKYHMTAKFDHVLYCQPFEHRLFVPGWTESFGPPKGRMEISKTQGTVAPDEHCYRKELKGRLANRDLSLLRA